MKPAPATIPTVSRGDAGELGQGHARGGRASRNRSGQPRQQVADAVHGHGSLHGAEVDRTAPAPRDRLDRRRAAHRADCGDQRHQKEGRQERPERRAELEVESGRPHLGQSEPGSRRHAFKVVETVSGADDGAQDHADHGSPQPQFSVRPERETPDHQHGCDEAGRRARRRAGFGGTFGGPREKAGHKRQHRDRDQHDHGARDGGREDALEERKPPGEEQRDQRGDGHEGGEQRGAALLKRRDGRGEEGAGGPHDEHMPHADAPQAESLEDGRQTADGSRREHGPREVGGGHAGGPHHHHGNQHHGGDVEHGKLEADAEREPERGLFVGLVAQRRFAAGPGAAHPAGPTQCRLRWNG